MPDATYSQEIQKLGLGAEVTLYQIDLTMLGGDMLYFTPMADQATLDGTLSFGGQLYTPFPIEVQGFKWTGSEAPPRPTISIGNLNHAMTSYVLQYKDLIGAQLRRIRTFERFLDTGDEPDPAATMPQDVFRFEKKTLHNDTVISWELASWIDHAGVMLPRRIVTRDWCQLVYRRYVSSSGTFDYSKATCPYVGTDYFDRDNNPTTIDQDVCSHQMTGCKLRFGNNPLPFGGFPGVAKFRT